jgi:hypothetical protein
MTRHHFLGLVLMVAAGLGGCTKPSDENCRKALQNMQVILGTENLNEKTGMEGEVRRCKGGSSREAVDCAIKAKTLEDLHACNFMKLPDKKK